MESLPITTEYEADVHSVTYDLKQQDLAQVYELECLESPQGSTIEEPGGALPNLERFVIRNVGDGFLSHRE